MFPGQGTKFPQATKQLNLYTTTTETRAAIRESMSHDERSSMPQLTQRSPIKKNLTELYTQDLCISLNVNITINVCFLNNFFKKEKLLFFLEERSLFFEEKSLLPGLELLGGPQNPRDGYQAVPVWAGPLPLYFSRKQCLPTRNLAGL